PLIPGQRNSPGLPCPADRDVFETAFEEPQDLVAPAGGFEKLGVTSKVLANPLLILRQPEEVVLLLNPLRRRQVLGTLAGDEIAFLFKGLAADAIPALVL